MSSFEIEYLAPSKFKKLPLKCHQTFKHAAAKTVPNLQHTCSVSVLFTVAIPSGICAKLRTVAASNNRVHMTWSLYYCLFVLFFTHMPFVVNHTMNAPPPERLQQHPLLFTTNRTDRTFFVWRLNSARPSHPCHSTILLRSEIPSGICAKLRTVAASNNRVHMPWSLYYCLFALHICMVLFFTHIPLVVNHTINATPPERLQHYIEKCPSKRLWEPVLPDYTIGCNANQDASLFQESWWWS